MVSLNKDPSPRKRNSTPSSQQKQPSYKPQEVNPPVKNAQTSTKRPVYHLDLTPEEKERLRRDLEEYKKKQDRLNEPATWGVGTWIIIIIVLAFFYYFQFKHW